MADTDSVLYGAAPAPPTPTPPAPPAGALDKGVTGDDPNNAVMAEASRLGGPLGASVIGAVQGAHQETAPQQDFKTITRNPKFLSLTPEVQQAVLVKQVPKFAALAPEVQQVVVKKLQGQGAAGFVNPEDVGTGPEGTLPELETPAAQADATKKLAMLTGAGVGALVGGPVGAYAGGGLAGSVIGGAAAGAAGTPVEQALTGQNPFRLKNLEQTAQNTILSGAGGGLLHAGGELLSKVTGPAEAAVPGEVTEGMFTHAPESPAPQHGVPVTVESPFDRATINNLPGGKGLSDEAVSTLQNYTGDKIPVGSTPKNTMLKAVAPVQETIQKTGLAMNKLIDDAPQFATSTIQDEGSTVLKDIEKIREDLPLREDDPLQKVVDKQVQAAYPALESTDPREILSMRRKLGNQIDWSNLTNTPTTAGEAADLTRAKLYNALSQKLKTIPGMEELDKIFQPNLELQSHFDAKLGKEVSRDAAEAASQQASEHAKGLRQIAVNEHNAKVDANISRTLKVLAALGAPGIGLLGYEIRKLSEGGSKE